MKKAFLIMMFFAACSKVWSGQVELPEEQVALPAVQGDYLICLWDETSQQWLQSHQAYDQSGSFAFQLPSWGKWYWIGLWDSVKQEYVFGKWIGHFVTH